MELPPEDGRKVGQHQIFCLVSAMLQWSYRPKTVERSPGFSAPSPGVLLQWSYRPKTVERPREPLQRDSVYQASMELPPEDGRKLANARYIAETISSFNGATARRR